MNRKSVLAHAILALGGLTLAYVVWTDDAPARERDEVVIVECAPDAVSRAVLRTADKDTTLEITRDGREATTRGTVVRRREGAEDETQQFVASSDGVTEWLAQIAPLTVRRTLGTLDAAQLAELGLAGDEATPSRFAITCGGTTHAYLVGGRAYGSGDRYLQLEAGGPVHLLGSERLQALESAEFRLMERRLHAFEWTAVTELRVEAWGQQKTLLQRNRLDTEAAEWVDQAAPDRRNETFGNWLSRYPQLRVQRYLAPGAEPGSELDEPAAAERSLSLVVRGERGELGRLELRRVERFPLVYYARTETTRDWVLLPTSVAQTFEDDARTVLGLDPLDRPEPPPPAAPTPTAPTDAGAEGAEASPAPSGDAPPGDDHGGEGHDEHHGHAH
ncbi:MAG: DUF4340 domain-containing protein [Sandaracinaceae bacterium]|nr:DUF4340 domain-containing protein [Sandaracinaceae bacterium]